MKSPMPSAHIHLRSVTRRCAVRRFGAMFVAMAAMIGATISSAGCRGERSDKPPRQFFPDMDDQMKWREQTKSEFFADGRTLRPGVPGTVAYARSSREPEGEAWRVMFQRHRDSLLRDDDAFFRGIDDNGDLLTYMPVTVTKELILRGQERYDIYCAVCHGYKGEGASGGEALPEDAYGGMVGRRWAIVVPNYHDEKYLDRAQRTAKDGYLFNVIRHGVPFPNPEGTALSMPSYGHAIDEADAWAIVAYIRVLQEVHKSAASTTPAGETN